MHTVCKIAKAHKITYNPCLNNKSQVLQVWKSTAYYKISIIMLQQGCSLLAPFKKGGRKACNKEEI